MKNIVFNNESNQEDSFGAMTDLMLQVIIGNEQTEAMLAYIVKDAPDEAQAQSFCKFVAALTCMAPEMREGFAKEMDDANVEGAMKLADMICEELHIWQYSQLHTNLYLRKGSDIEEDEYMDPPFEYWQYITDEWALRDYIKQYVDFAVENRFDADMIAEQVSKFAKYKEILANLDDDQVLVLDDSYLEEPEIVSKAIADQWD